MQNKPSQYIDVLSILMKDTRQVEKKLLVKICVYYLKYMTTIQTCKNEKEKENHRSVTDKQHSQKNTCLRVLIKMVNI
jgi:hypothetical protein